MTIRDKMKAELDRVDGEYLGVVQRMILSLERPSHRGAAGESWGEFLVSTYGSMADAPIERGPKGDSDVRENLR